MSLKSRNFLLIRKVPVHTVGMVKSAVKHVLIFVQRRPFNQFLNLGRAVSRLIRSCVWDVGRALLLVQRAR